MSKSLVTDSEGWYTHGWVTHWALSDRRFLGYTEHCLEVHLTAVPRAEGSLAGLQCSFTLWHWMICGSETSWIKTRTFIQVDFFLEFFVYLLFCLSATCLSIYHILCHKRYPGSGKTLSSFIYCLQDCSQMALEEHRHKASTRVTTLASFPVLNPLLLCSILSETFLMCLQTLRGFLFQEAGQLCLKPSAALHICDVLLMGVPQPNYLL